MKDKRYFCDYWFGKSESNKIETLIMVIAIIVIVVLGSIISYNVFVGKNSDELNSYSESTYQYLDEIADNVIQEGVGIDLMALPDDVVKYEVTYENNEIIFKYYFDNNKDKEFAESANMTVKLSNNYEIISKQPNYSSEEDYVGNIKFVMALFSFMIGMLSAIAFMISGLIICTIIACISKVNKNKNMQKNLS